MTARHSVMLSLAMLLAPPAVASAAPVDHSKRCGPPQGPPAFQSYWLGAAFEGAALAERTYLCVPASLDTESRSARRVNTEGFFYGECEQAPCGPQFEIQVHPACDRTFASYDFVPGIFARPPLTRIRGVPAAFFYDGAQIELYTGDVTVVLLGDEPARVRRAAQALSSTPGSQTAVPAGAPLPPPVTGHTSQTLYCGLARFRVRPLGRSTPARSCFNGGRCRHQRLRLTLSEPAMVWGEAQRPGDRASPVPDSLTQFGFRASRGTRTYRIDVRGRGRFVATLRAMTRDGRRSRPVRLRFVVR
jgi:hypothetical protein